MFCGIYFLDGQRERCGCTPLACDFICLACRLVGFLLRAAAARHNGRPCENHIPACDIHIEILKGVMSF